MFISVLDLLLCTHKSTHTEVAVDKLLILFSVLSWHGHEVKSGVLVFVLKVCVLVLEGDVLLTSLFTIQIPISDYHTLLVADR